MSLSWKFGLAAFILSLAGSIFVQVEADLAAKLLQNPNPCGSKRTCKQCIQTVGCTWCSDPKHGDKPRCFQLNTQINYCPEPFTYNQQNEMIMIKNATLSRSSSGSSLSSGQAAYGMNYAQNSSYSSSYSSKAQAQWGSSGSASLGGQSSSSFAASSSQKVVQVYPQHVRLKLRINEPYNLGFQYSQAQDYPVDLYYLMDLSKSMEDDKDKLSSLGDQLSSTMSEITSNFRLGFGSFVDKVLMPFVSTIPSKLQHPCEGCEAPYGFRNHMKLSTNTSSFNNEVRAAQISGNLDTPEGGFDAIMQAIACREAIGWREQARRLLVFSTDAGFHYAGDGKLAGVIEPNDGNCHLDTRGEYTLSQFQDYPSISQINHKVKEHSINIIFAVTQQQIDIYNKLSKHIEGSSSAVLSNDSSNVVQLVYDEYKKISSSIEMKDTAPPYINITYYSSCLTGGEEYATSKCDNIKAGNVVTFHAKILVTSCPPNPKDWQQTIQIYPIGLDESITVDLELLCSCPCEKKGSPLYEENSQICHGHGDYMCGICECDNSHIGQHCECSVSDASTNNNNNYGCRPDNTTQVDCSGRGHCLCGVCECDKRTDPLEIISGQYCECDNFACDRTHGLVCSGPDHGTCECGACVCKPGWTGPACDCLSTIDTCKAPNSDEICSGHGECVCGECKCRTTEEGRHYGKYCEKCPDCSKRCTDLRDCVQCQMFGTGPLKDNCLSNCTTFTPRHVDKVVQVQDEYLCTFLDEDDCKFFFKYSEENGTLAVTAAEERECPPKVFMLGIVLGVIAAIVLIGLAILLLWKLLTTIHDRREFARFEKERMNAKWDTGENPIYKQATSTFKNPMYAGK